MLSRLGVMIELDGIGHRHGFPKGWRPVEPLNLVRHPGEPTVFDLVLGLCFLVDWDARSVDFRNLQKSDRKQNPPKFDLDTTPFKTPERDAFQEFAFLTGCSVLENLGLGKWTEDAGFEVVPELSEDSRVRIMDIYRQSSFNLANRLGGYERLYPATAG